jgi:hypothetical protein
MPRSEKYTEKQKRRAHHIEETHLERGLSQEEAELRAWTTANTIHRGVEKPGGSGRTKPMIKKPARSGGKKSGEAAASPSKASRSASAKKAVRTRQRKAAGRNNV